MNFPTKVSLNGKIVKAEDANISIFDRGFLFGDGIYEVMIQLNGKLFYEQAHLDRLDSGLDKIGIKYNTSNLKQEIQRLLIESLLKDSDCLIYIQVTRGVAPRKHAFPENTTPTCLIYAIEKSFPKINNTHYSVITANDFRWSKCDIKMTSLLGNVLANQFATENDCYETLLVRDGIFTEASHCNVFFVKEGVVYTHPANEFILNGITRMIVIDLCNKLKIPVVEDGFSLAHLDQIDEAFLTGTTTQIGAIDKINGLVLFEGNNLGPVTRQLQEAFSELC